MAQTTDAPAGVNSDIKFDVSEIDYGSIEKGSNGVREFTFTNPGTEPLQITNARGSCGCTVPSYSKDPVLPGAKSVIQVKYDTNRVGPFSKTVTVNTNSATTPVVTLRIHGTVNAPAVEEAPQVPQFQPVDAPQVEAPKVAPAPKPVPAVAPVPTKVVEKTEAKIEKEEGVVKAQTKKELRKAKKAAKKAAK
ncbi:MAG: DUF1573 domain-containing protein [Chitinophagales bacterium]|nr:DUF1573 domain-containing protein [Chitinophagales bacterium]